MKVLENLSIQENLFPLNHTEESKLRGVSPDKELLTMQSYLSDSCKIGQTSNYQICALLITLWSAFLSSEASAPTPFSSVHRDICSSSCWQSLQFTCLCGFPAHGILNLIFSCQSISCPIDFLPSYKDLWGDKNSLREDLTLMPHFLASHFTYKKMLGQ